MIQQSLDARRAAALTQQLARQVDPQMPWSAAASTGGALRTIAKSPKRNGAAMMTWTNGAGARLVLFYVAGTDPFAAILRTRSAGNSTKSRTIPTTTG